ncbi:hypothetical protein [Pseudomonas farris]
MAEEQDRIDQLIYRSQDEGTKLDYFIQGATLAICAYLAQTNPYGQLGLNKETFLLGSLLVFAVSAILGFKRLEAKVTFLFDNAEALQTPDRALRSKVLLGLRTTNNTRAVRLYKYRNITLLLGLVCYVITKVWAAYQNNGWIPVH